jgi:hypothetical protein
MNCIEHAPKNCTIDSPELQGPLYAELKAYSFADHIRDPDTGDIVSADYYKVDSIDGIDFYTPNDEDWGSIVAISHEHKLAHDTSFYEMDDMASPAPYDDYAMVVVDGKMGCRFDLIPYDAAMMDPEANR